MRFLNLVIPVLFLTIGQFSLTKASFSDVDHTHPYFQQITNLQNQNIVEGYDDGTYRPDNSLNRVEFLKIVLEASNKNLDAWSSQSLNYADINDPNSWYIKYLKAGKGLGLMQGYPDQTVRPDASINYVEASKIISNSFNQNISIATTTSDDHLWYQEYVDFIENSGAKPSSITTPDQNLTRGEMAYMIAPFLSNNNTTTDTIQQGFLEDELTTNTAISAIPLSEIFGGGPEKDGIPALSNPKYISINDAQTQYNDDSKGVLIEVNGDRRWASYDILYWHEIINDDIGGIPVALTFCPLCGSVLAFDRTLSDGSIAEFGVSGKLWQSNLLMYDKKTESLWSQIEGQAKVGFHTGKNLEIIDSQILTWGEVKNMVDLKVLSQDTGYTREYGQNPYGTYENNSNLIFPIKNQDKTLESKTLMIAGNYNNIPFALERLALLTQKPSSITVDDTKLNITTTGGLIEVTTPTGAVIPTFNTMWFSWANHWKTNDSVVWIGTDVETSQNPTATLKTNKGDIVIELLSDDAPEMVKNFLTLSHNNKYDNTLFHRVIDGFMIQGGDYQNFDGTGGQSYTGTDLSDEISPNLSHSRGMVSMANRGPNTNGSQFFIVQSDSIFLDGGYSIFGQVLEGMDVVDLIAKVEVGAADRPVDNITLIEVIIDDETIKNINIPTLETQTNNTDDIVITEYFSYGCSYCKQIHDTLDGVLSQKPEVTFNLKHFIVYENFLPIHEAQVCATEQGLGYEFHDLYFNDYYPSTETSSINKITQSLNLNQDDFNNCLASDRPSQKITSDTQAGVNIGVRGTPTLTIKSSNTNLKALNARTTETIITEIESLEK